MTKVSRNVISPRLLGCLVTTLIVFAVAASVPAFADPPLPGAVFTTNSGCTGVDLNIYAAKTDVYLQGGPDHGGANPPPGSYYVQVTAPDGTLLGTSVGASNPTPFVVDISGNANCFEVYNAVISIATAQ